MPTTSTPDLERLRKAVQEFQPSPHRVPFTSLKLVHDSIVDMRRRKFSYATITDLLQQHGVKTSRARVAEYGRIVLDGGKTRRRRKRAKSESIVAGAAAPQSAPAVTAKPTPATPAPASNFPSPSKENFAFASRRPRIAKVEQLPPGETIA